MGRWAVLLLGIGVAAYAADQKGLALGDRIPEFKGLVSADGKNVSLSNFKQDVLIIAVTCNECPVARSYEPRLVNFIANQDGKKVALLALNPYDRPGDTLEEMKARVEEAKLNFPYAQDKELAKALGAEKTPHFFVFDKNRRLVYKGAFDDSWIDPESVKQRYVENAVSALLSGQSISPATTKAEGCAIHY